MAKVSIKLPSQLLELSSTILGFHTATDWSVPSLPKHAVLLLKIGILNMVGRTKVSI